MLRQRLFALVFGIAIAAPALAMPITYDESVDGDLSGVAGTDLGPLGLGVNTVVGTWRETGVNPSDTDRFLFQLVAGLTIESIVFNSVMENGEVYNVSLGANPGNLFDDAFVGGSAPVINASFFDSTGPDMGPLPTSSPSSWDMSLIGSVIFQNGHSWSVTITTSGEEPMEPEVPVPATLSLLALSLFILRRRQWSARTV